MTSIQNDTALSHDAGGVNTLVSLIQDLDFAITSFKSTEQVAGGINATAIKERRKRMEEQRRIIELLCVKAGIDFKDIEHRALAIKQRASETA